MISSRPPGASLGTGGETRTPDPSADPPPVGAAPAGDPGPPFRYRWDQYLDHLGQGGVGIVYQAWDVILRRWVAIKILQEHHRGSLSIRQRFQREGYITARLRHHGIPSIHEVGELSDGLPFIAMRLVDGRTLESLLREREARIGGPPAGGRTPEACRRERVERAKDLTRYLTIFLQVAQAMAHAHGQGIIHRDLKPANVMVGEFGVVVVLDWGLAKVIDASGTPNPTGGTPAAPPFDEQPDFRLTREGAVFGTPAYLPPEQARGENARADRRADVFGLGAILCEILTGHPPYVGDTDQAMLQRAIAADLADAHARLAAYDGPLDLIQLAEKCLNADPAERYDSAADVAEVITGYLQSEQRQAERRLSQFFDLSLDLLCIATMDGYFQEINGNFHAVLGHPEEELTNRPFVAFVHPDDVEKTVRECERLALGEQTVLFVNRYRHKDGHYIHLEWNARAVLGEQLIYAVARDVSKRYERAEADRRAEEDRRHLAAAVHSADESIVQLSRDGTIVSWNPGAERLFGYTREVMIGRRFDHLIPPSHARDEEDRFRRVRDGGPDETHEAVRFRKDGTRVVVSIRATAVRDAAGGVTGVVKVARDISDRQQLEDMIAGLPDGFITIDETGGIVSVNPSAERMFGYAPGELLGENVRRLIPPEFHYAHDAGLQRVLATGEARMIGTTVELPGLRQDGSRFPLGLSLSQTWVEGRRRFAGVIRDHSARQAAEVLAAECQKAAGFFAAAAAVLAGGADLTETLRHVTALAVARLGVACARIWTVDEATRTLVLQASAGLDSHPVGGHACVPLGGCAVGLIAQERTPRHAPDASDSDWMRAEGLVTFAGYPLTVGERLLGVNAVFARQPLSANVVEAVGAASHALALRLHAHRERGR